MNLARRGKEGKLSRKVKERCVNLEKRQNGGNKVNKEGNRVNMKEAILTWMGKVDGVVEEEQAGERREAGKGKRIGDKVCREAICRVGAGRERVKGQLAECVGRKYTG